MNEWTGGEIREARRSLRLTQTALAHAIGVSPQAVQKWESGAAHPSLANAHRLSEVLSGEPAPDNLTQLRRLVEAQTELLMLLVEEARQRSDEHAELDARLAQLEVVAGRRLRP